MVGRSPALCAALVTVSLMVLFPSASRAQERLGRAGRLISLSGTLTAWLDGNESSPSVQLKRGASVPPGAVLATGKESVARLLMDDDTIIYLGSNTRLRLHRYDVEPKTKQRKVNVRLLVGRLWARVTKALTGEEQFEVDTGNAVAGVRGTQFVVAVDEGGLAEITCVTGRVGLRAGAEEGETLLEPMQQGSVDADGAISLGAVSAEQVSVMARALHGVPTLDRTAAAVRAQQVESAIDLRAAKAAAAAGGGLIEQLDSEVASPPLDLDPAAGSSNVTVQVVVQE